MSSLVYAPVVYMYSTEKCHLVAMLYNVLDAVCRACRYIYNARGTRGATHTTEMFSGDKGY